MEEAIQSLPMQTNIALQKAQMELLQRQSKAASPNQSGVQGTVQGSDGQEMSDEKKKGFAKVARGFESMFMHEMYKTMRQSMLDEDEKQGEDDLSFGGDTLQGYTDMQFADSISQMGSGMGLAQMLYKKLTGDDHLPAIITQHSGKLINDSPQALGGAKASDKGERRESSPTAHNKFHPRTVVATPSAPPNTNFMERVQNRLENYAGTIEKAAEKFGVPTALVKAIITAESAGNPNAVSPVGAKGLMQLMDGTAKDLDVSNPFDPRQNIMGGTEYIARMMKTFGRLDHAIAAYNAGPGNVKKHDGIPPFAETQAYVRKVQRYMSMYAADGEG